MKLETKVGLFVAIALFMFFTGVLWKSAILMRAKGYMIVGEFKNVNGLLTGSEVRYRGFLIGYVSTVTPGPKSIRVKIFVKKGVLISEGSNLRVDFDGLVGEKYLSLIPNSDSDKPIKPGSVIPGRAASTLVDFVDVGTTNLLETKKILEVFREILTSNESKASLRGMISNVNTFTEKMNDLIDKVNGLLEQKNIDTYGKNIESIFDGVESVLNNVNTLVVGMSNTVSNADNQKNIDETIDNFNKFSEKLNGLTDEIKKDKDRLFKDITPLIEETKLIISNSKGITLKLDQSLGGLTKVNVGADASLMSTQLFEVGSQAQYDNNILKLYIGNELSSGSTVAGTSVQLKSLLYGQVFMNNIKALIGIVNSSPGINLDYRLTDQISLESSFYNLSDMNYAVRGNYNFLPNLRLMLGLDKTSSEQIFSFGIGVNSGRK
jgi:phospholipid/cholesterol/gamma-HCH transport system substrate-binding protein